MEIYVHSRTAEGVVLVDAEPTWTVEELIARSGAVEGSDAWLEDGEDPLERTSMLVGAAVKERAHVHVSTCRMVGVSVRYGGGHQVARVSPRRDRGQGLRMGDRPSGLQPHNDRTR